MISIKFRPWPVLSLLSIIALAVLLTLGQWQFARYDQKRHLKASPPETASLGPIVDAPGGAVFLHGVWNGKPGWRVIRAVRIGAAPNIETVLVDAGFIEGVSPPDPLSTDRATRDAFPPGVSLAGTWHTPPPPGPFAPKPDIKRAVFYAWDLPAMRATMDLAAPRAQVFLLPYVGVDGTAGPNPFTAFADPLPPERHLGYALTWWGLAAALVGVYLFYHARTGRLIVRRPS
jgi:surfeit locus 1 family protein